METIKLDSQEVRIIERDDWDSPEFISLFSSWKNFDFNRLYQWLETHSKYTGVTIGIVGHPGRCFPISLVNIDGEYHRVHIENVICEHCGNRSGISATPGPYDLYIGCENPNKAMERSMSLPVKLCIHCGKPLNRRHTIWFEHEQYS